MEQLFQKHPQPSPDLETSRVILITGCGKGLGLEAGIQLLQGKTDYRVILTTRKEHQAQRVAKILKLKVGIDPAKVFVRTLDVTKIADVEGFASWL